jgi:hypothetical protein
MPATSRSCRTQRSSGAEPLDQRLQVRDRQQHADRAGEPRASQNVLAACATSAGAAIATEPPIIGGTGGASRSAIRRPDHRRDAARDEPAGAAVLLARPGAPRRAEQDAEAERDRRGEQRERPAQIGPQDPDVGNAAGDERAREEEPPLRQLGDECDRRPQRIEIPAAVGAVSTGHEQEEVQEHERRRRDDGAQTGPRLARRREDLVRDEIHDHRDRGLARGERERESDDGEHAAGAPSVLAPGDVRHDRPHPERARHDDVPRRRPEERSVHAGDGEDDEREPAGRPWQHATQHETEAGDERQEPEEAVRAIGDRLESPPRVIERQQAGAQRPEERHLERRVEEPRERAGIHHGADVLGYAVAERVEREGRSGRRATPGPRAG